MPPFLGSHCWSSFNDKTPLPGAKAILTYCAHALFFFPQTLKECIPDLFDVLHSDKMLKQC